jgi:hypothetical protein
VVVSPSLLLVLVSPSLVVVVVVASLSLSGSLEVGPVDAGRGLGGGRDHVSRSVQSTA